MKRISQMFCPNVLNIIKDQFIGIYFMEAKYLFTNKLLITNSLSWNQTGDLIATGSNDKTIKLMRFNSQNCEIEGGEAELTMHDGTVRDMCFMDDLSNHSSLLISGGAGDCKIYITDCDTATPFQALSGHSGSLYLFCQYSYY